MQHWSDTADAYSAGSVIAASLAPRVLADFDPAVRRLLGGNQEFTKQADGRWRPCGCSLGLARCFAYGDLCEPCRRAIPPG